jgi:hypothetical protein
MDMSHYSVYSDISSDVSLQNSPQNICQASIGYEESKP